MMTKKLITKGMAVMAIMGSLAACSHDHDVYQPSKEEKMANARAQLGVDIDPNHNWQMTASATARVSVNMSYGETYTVQVYSNDPLAEGNGYVLTKIEVQDGQTVEKTFEYPSALRTLVVSVTDSKGFTSYKSATVVDGILTVGFGSQAASARGETRSETSPEVPHITIPDDAYAKSFLEGAAEANYNNARNNYDNSTWESSGEVYSIDWNNPQDIDDKDHFFGEGKYQGLSWEERIAWAQENRPNWLRWKQDENYATKFKITGSYNDDIPVMGSRPVSIYVSGTWTLPAGWSEESTKQVVANEGLVIIVDQGGVVNIPRYAQLNLQNQARLVVMPGGKITGDGKILVTNGNAEGLEGYNGGSIDIATFNNNFGKFYNYGTFKCTKLEGGGSQSNFYNHGVAHIVRSGYASESGGNYDTANTRIYNACQWICDEDMRAYVVEMAQGSYFYVGGELMMSDGTDGTATNSYVALASGALMQVHSLWNNNTSWTGPTSGYAVVELGQATYMNWTGQPVTQGYFINNIAVSVDDKTVGAGSGQGTDTYVALRDYVSNGHGATGDVNDPIGKETVGNNGTIMVEKGGANMSVPASDDFEAGVEGCTPGYNGSTTTTITTKQAVWSYAFEDTPLGDYDMNDVVIKVSQNPNAENKIDVTLCCAGASFDLKVWLDDVCILYGKEVHEVLGQSSGTLINTGKGPWAETVTATVTKPAGFTFAYADFWIESLAVPAGVHIAREGEDPHGVVIPEDWAWPVEYVCIKDAYPDFAKFAEDASTTDENVKKWYQTPVESLVIRR